MIKGKRFLTINTDASLHHEFKIGGYAFWIVSDDFVYKKSNKIKEPVQNALHAEAMAIGNAVYSIQKVQDKIIKPDVVVFNSDCKSLLNMLQSQKIKDPIVSKVKEMINNLFPEEKVFYKHVKAHTTNAASRSYVNRWCDEMAKKAMREAVKQLHCHG